MDKDNDSLRPLTPTIKTHSIVSDPRLAKRNAAKKRIGDAAARLRLGASTTAIASTAASPTTATPLTTTATTATTAAVEEQEQRDFAVVGSKSIEERYENAVEKGDVIVLGDPSKTVAPPVAATAARATASDPPPPSPSPTLKASKTNDERDTTNTTGTSSTSSTVRFKKEDLDVCCICLDELSHDKCKNGRALCCGKEWHVKCHHDVQKSKMPYHLKIRCHHCRKPFGDNDECVKQLRKWLAKDTPWAQITMSQWYRDGLYGVKQSYVMAAMLLEKAVKQGDPDAMNTLAISYGNGQGVSQSYKKAAELYAMAAAKGQVKSMHNLAYMYQHGRGVVQSFKKAFELYTTAAEQGLSGAMNKLANMYLGGNGVAQSFKNAFKLYTMAAEQGHAIAMYNLGLMYEKGQGVVQSFQKAFELYTVAAYEGYASAMNCLGTLYICGQGVAQSNKLARAWWIKAANEGYEGAIKNLKKLDEMEATPDCTTIKKDQVKKSKA